MSIGQHARQPFCNVFLLLLLLLTSEMISHLCNWKVPGVCKDILHFATVVKTHEERDVNHFHLEVRSAKRQAATQSRLQSIHRIMFADSRFCQSGMKQASALHIVFKD